MKSNGTILGLASITIGCGFYQNASGQEYDFSAPLTGHLALYLTDMRGYPAGGGNLNDPPARAVLMLGLSTLSEQVYIDPTAQTVRQVGFISMNTASGTSSLQYSHFGATIATGSLYQEVVGGGIAFDTGPRGFAWDESQQKYTFDGSFNNTISISGTYSFLTGGQALSGPFAYTLNGSGAHTFSSFTLNPQSLTLDGLGIGPPYYYNEAEYFGGTPLDMTATNGVHFQLQTGDLANAVLWDGFTWASGQVVANLVPEPGPLSLLALFSGGSLLRFCRPRNREVHRERGSRQPKS